jgi:uncharacterized protein DUF2809
MRQSSRAWAAALSFSACAFVAVYRGPGWRPLRSHGGDAFATLFLFFLLGLVPQAGSPARRAIITAAVALGIELLQAGGVVNQASGMATQLLLGSTFDPWDCLAYAVGIAAGFGLEAFARAQRSAPIATGITGA